MIVTGQSPSAGDLREWLTLGIALAAVIVGPVIQYFVAKRDREAHAQALKSELDAQRATTERQIFASVRASNRQTWINALRDDVATYLNLLQRMAWLRAHGMQPNNDNELEQLMFQSGRIFSAIELRLNPNEDRHIELMTRLSKLTVDILADPTAFNGLRDSVVEQAQVIFKFEWNRVKIGE